MKKIYQLEGWIEDRNGNRTCRNMKILEVSTDKEALEELPTKEQVRREISAEYGASNNAYSRIRIESETWGYTLESFQENEDGEMDNDSYKFIDEVSAELDK